VLSITGNVVDISPVVPTYLGCGPDIRVEPEEAANLEANLLLIRGSQVGLILIITIDALYVGPDLRSALEDSLGGLLTAEQIFLAASHTHNAPMLDKTKPGLGHVSDQHFRAVANKISRAAIGLFDQEFTNAALEPSQYSVKTAINRRYVRPIVIRRNGIYLFKSHLLPNRKDKLFPTSEVVEFRSPSGDILAALWVMPCHPVSFPGPTTISPHFIGKVREEYRILNGAQRILPFLFLQGASGDLRPPAYRSPLRSFRNILGRVVIGKEFDFFSRGGYESWVRSVLEEFGGRAKSANWKLDGLKDGVVKTRRSMLPLKDYYKHSLEIELSMVCHQVEIEGLEFVGVSAEPTWKFRDVLLDSYSNVTMVGCIDNCHGYLASPRQAEEGGYEVTGFLKPFDLTQIKKSKPSAKLLQVLASLLKSDAPSSETGEVRAD
jgi:hypothetical protein